MQNLTATNDNIAGHSNPNAFVVGETYSCRSACDHGTIYSWTVIRRTAKSIWLSEEGDETKRVKIQESESGEEFALPAGRYSMCPVIRA